MATNTLTEALDSAWTATWPHFRAGVIDAVFLKQYPFFFWLSQKGKVQYIDGGRDIRFPLEVDVNPTVTEIAKNGEVSLADTDPFTTVIYNWGTIAGNINRYREDDRQNRGKAVRFNLAQAKAKNLQKTISKKFETVLFRAEDAKPSGGFNSVLDLVDDTPTSSKTVGGFDQSSYEWWRNVTRTAAGAAAIWLRKDMQRTFYDLEDVSSSPDVAICHRNSYEVYEDDLLEMKMIINKALADASFDHLVFKGIPLIKSPSCPSTRLWLLNSEFFYLVLDRGMSFVMTPWKERLAQPFNRVAQIVVRGQFICSNRRAQATLHTITY